MTLTSTMMVRSMSDNYEPGRACGKSTRSMLRAAHALLDTGMVVYITSSSVEARRVTRVMMDMLGTLLREVDTVTVRSRGLSLRLAHDKDRTRTLLVLTEEQYHKDKRALGCAAEKPTLIYDTN